MPSKIEDTIINQTIVEYFEAYFNPFEGFTDEERQKMKDTLLLKTRPTASMRNTNKSWKRNMERTSTLIQPRQIPKKAKTSPDSNARRGSCKQSSMTQHPPKVKRECQEETDASHPGGDRKQLSHAHRAQAGKDRKAKEKAESKGTVLQHLL